MRFFLNNCVLICSVDMQWNHNVTLKILQYSHVTDDVWRLASIAQRCCVYEWFSPSYIPHLQEDSSGATSIIRGPDGTMTDISFIRIQKRTIKHSFVSLRERCVLSPPELTTLPPRGMFIKACNNIVAPVIFYQPSANISRRWLESWST